MNRTSKKYWRRTVFYSRFLRLVPFIRCIILNGSVAAGTAKATSDIDLLVIAKSGRIFTARFLLLALASILMVKRPKDEAKSHAGKFCFNYFLTEDYLNIPIGRGQEIDQYCAENYSKSVLVRGDGKLFGKFVSENWSLFLFFRQSCPLISFRPTFSPLSFRPTGGSGEIFGGTSVYHHDERSLREVYPELVEWGRDDRKAEGSFTDIVKLLLEFPLNGRFGNRLEKVLKKWQVASIEKDPRTKKYPGLIVYNDRELRFHPPRQGFAETGRRSELTRMQEICVDKREVIR